MMQHQACLQEAWDALCGGDERKLSSSSSNTNTHCLAAAFLQLWPRPDVKSPSDLFPVWQFWETVCGETCWDWSSPVHISTPVPGTCAVTETCLSPGLWNSCLSHLCLDRDTLICAASRTDSSQSDALFFLRVCESQLSVQRLIGDVILKCLEELSLLDSWPINWMGNKHEHISPISVNKAATWFVCQGLNFKPVK